jgi:hypothetical protein
LRSLVGGVIKVLHAKCILKMKNESAASLLALAHCSEWKSISKDLAECLPSEKRAFDLVGVTKPLASGGN